MGKKLRLALEAVSSRPSADDTQTSEKRSAYALELLAAHVLDAPSERNTAERPHVSILVSEDTWSILRTAKAKARAALRAKTATEPALTMTTTSDATRKATEPDEPCLADDPGAADEPGVAEVPGGIDQIVAALHGQDPIRDVDGQVLPPSEIGRLLCDCELSRLTLTAKSEVLDHGHTQRLFTPAQRRAITTRDGGCAWPDCTMPARHTETHHLRWWNRDCGETGVHNGVALCSYHHHLIHQNNYVITRNTPETMTARSSRGDPMKDHQFPVADPPSPTPLDEPTAPPSPTANPRTPRPRHSTNQHHQVDLSVLPATPP